MGEYSIQQQQFISAYRNTHHVPVMLNDDAVVEMIKEEMIKSGKVYPEFASLLDKGKSAQTGKTASVFETMNAQTDFISDRLEKTPQNKKINLKKTYTPHEKSIARKYIAEMLKNKIYEAIYGEQGFNVIANPNKISGSEAWQEMEVIGASLVHNLSLGRLGIDEPLNRKDLSKSLNIAFRRIEELEALVDNPDKFDKKYKELTRGKEMDYSAVIDYMKAVSEHQSSYIQDKLSTLEQLKEPAERFEKTLNIPAVKNFNKWAGRQETSGSLTGLAIDMALAYMSGGMTAASNAAMKVGQGVTKAVTEQAVKSGVKREAAEITGQVAGITSSQVTGAGLNSAMFQATRIAGALEDGNFTAQEFDAIGASYVSLFKFGYVGSAISGPLGAKFGEWAGRLINNEKTVSAIINSSLNRPTTLGKLLTNLSEYTGIVQKATEFGTSFVINTEYMAQDEGISFEEALTNLAQMEGVSKMVMAFLGGKTTKFLTPEKVQKITTEIENCKVEIAVYRGQKAIKVTTPEGKENFFATHEELIAFVADRVYTAAGVGVGVNVAESAPKSPQLRDGKTTPTPQSQVEPKTLEGGVKDTELTEVAPFAERLDRSITPDDLIPERKVIDLENGEFTSEGEFKSDGTHSVSDAPIADAPYDAVYREKFATYKKMPGGNEQIIATTPKNLSKQILNITGGKKVYENLQNSIDRLIKDGNVSVKDISEVIVTLEYLTNNSSFAKEFLRPENLEKIKDFQSFKSNLDSYARFKYQMDRAPENWGQDFTWDVGSQKVKNLLNRSIEFENLIKLGDVKPEEFNKNIDIFYKLGFRLKETICYDRTSFSDFMFQAHSDKFFERLDYINEFNRQQDWQRQNAYYVNIRTEGGLENDANFEIIKKNIETYKRARQYDTYASNMLRNGNTVEADWFEDFEAKFPDETKRKYAYNQFHWLVREGHRAENIQKFADFINALPEGILESIKALQENYYGDYDNIFANFRRYNKNGDTKDYAGELVKRAKILAKCPYLLYDGYNHHTNAFDVKSFLCDTEFKDTDKVLEFAENAEPFALAKYRMNTEYQNDKNFAQIMNEANLDLWIENAKLHNEINPKFREYLNSKEALCYKGGFNEKFDYAYDIPTEQLKARIDAINKYADKLDMRVLDYIYVGRIPADTKILDALTQLEPEVINNFEYYGSFKYVYMLGLYGEQGLKNFITFANKYKNRRDLIKNIQNVGFSDIMNNLTEAEISKLNSHRITDDNSAFKPDIDMIRKRIASIPEKVRKYFVDEKNILTDKWNDKIFDEFGHLTNDNPFKYLNTLSEKELKTLGSETMAEFINMYHQSYGNPVKSFDPKKLKALTELPEPMLAKLSGEAKYRLLVLEDIDVQKITARYNELVKFNRFEIIDNEIATKICIMPDYSYNLITEIIKLHNDKLADNDFKYICKTMPANEGFEKSEIEYIRKQLINNPKNNPKDIDSELRFLYGRYTTLAKQENRPFQKEVLEDMIERGSSADVEIGLILIRIGNREIDTAKIVYDCALTCWNDPAVKPEKIGELIGGIGENNSSFAQKAFHHPKFMGKKDVLPQILQDLNENNQNLADFMFLESDKFSVEDGNRILQYVKQDNKEFVERICKEGGLTNQAIAKLAEYTVQKGNVDKADKLLTSDEMKHWTEENLNNGLDIETLTHLGRTQKKLYTESKQVKDAQDIKAKKEEARRIQTEHAQAEVKADVDALETITKELVALNVPEGMAKNAYAKLCVDSNGNIDRMKLDAVRALIKTYGVSKTTNDKGKLKINVNISPKDITDIFKLATGDKLSAQNGMFRPEVIKDIITLKECGVDDIKFATNLASVKNMGLIEMKARFKGETRQDLAKRIDEWVNDNTPPQPSPLREGAAPAPYGEGREGVRSKLLERGIDIDAIKEKALTSDKKIEDAKFKEGQGTAQIRSLDAIVGTERQVLNKFKDQVQPEVWQNPDAFKRWAEEKLADISDWDKHPEYVSKDYADYNKPRQEGLEKWVDFLKSDESGVKDDIFAQILFLDGITKEMKPDNAYTPPAISREVFEHVYNEILAGNTDVSFTQAYSELNKKKAIEKYGTPTVSEDGIEGTWVKIPQSQKGEEFYDEHVAMVQALAQGSAWCLRFENAHGYLQSGDIHFFVDSKGDSQVAINVYPNGQIHDMQRRYKQDGTVPIPYIVPIAKYYKEHNFSGREKAIQDALNAKPEFDRQKVEFAKMLEEGRTADIFNELGDNSYAHEIKVNKAEDGSYILDNYTPFIKGKPYSLYDLGINEDVLFENVSEITQSMYLDGSALKTAPKLKKVGNHITFGDNKANDFRALEEISGKKVSWDKPKVKTPSEIRKEGNRYNEKDKSESNMIDDIEKKVAMMTAEYKARKAAENGEESELPTWEEIQQRRLPDFTDREDFYDDLMDRLNKIDHTIIDIADFNKSAAIIKNKQLKKVAETICKNNQLSKSLMDYIRDVDAGLENIKDAKLAKYLRDELKKLSSTEYEPERYDGGEYNESNFFRVLSNVGDLVDVYNTLNGKYSRYKSIDLLGADIYSDISRPAAFMEKQKLFAFMMSLEGSVEKTPRMIDFENLEKTEALEQLSNKTEMLDYMYEKYYVSKIENAKVRKLCRDIERKYGVRVLLSAKTHNIQRALNVIQNELENWTKLSEGKAILPIILDLNSCDITFEEAAAYTNLRGNIHHDGAKINSSRIIRHEIMHLNESNLYSIYSGSKDYADLIRSIIPSKTIEKDGQKKEVLDWDNCKYREEFLKAGIDPEHVRYAYTNKNEFLSVAAEGDMSQYSPEFRQVLIKIGMPEYVFDLPLNDFRTDCNVDRVSDILKEHPNAKYDELVKYIEEKREQAEKNAEVLFKELFGKKNKSE